MARRKTTVGTHFKPSLGRYVPTYQREQEHADQSIEPLVEAPPKEALLGLVQKEPKKKPVLSFPLASYKPKKKGWWKRASESVNGYHYQSTGYLYPIRWWSYPSINRKGEGYILARNVTVPGVWYRSLCDKKLVIGPNQTIEEEDFLHYKDYSNLNMPGSTTVGDMSNITWSGANLENSLFTSGGGETFMSKMNFDGAVLRGAKIVDMGLADVSMRGADLTDFEFKINTLTHRNRVNLDYEFTIDLTDSNVTKEQFDSIMEQVGKYELDWSTRMDKPNPIRINRYSARELIDKTGIDEDELTVLLWGGDIEYRNKSTDLPDEDGFDYELHYIPQWEMQRVTQERGAQ